MKNETLHYLKSVVQGAVTLIQSVQPEDLDWQPPYGGRTLLEIITHLSTLIESDIKGGLGELDSAEKMNNFEQTADINSVEDAIERIEVGLSYATNTFEKIEGVDMNNREVQFFYQEEPETYTHLLVELIEHLSLHKGILFSYLRQLGYQAGMTTYYGISPAKKA